MIGFLGDEMQKISTRIFQAQLLLESLSIEEAKNLLKGIRPGSLIDKAQSNAIFKILKYTPNITFEFLSPILDIAEPRHEVTKEDTQLIQQLLHEVRMGKVAVIRKCRKSDFDPKRPKSQQMYCLYTSDGSKLLGRHPSKAKALKQEQAININK